MFCRGFYVFIVTQRHYVFTKHSEKLGFIALKAFFATSATANTKALVL